MTFIDNTDVANKQDALTIVRMVGLIKMQPMPVIINTVTEHAIFSMWIQFDEVIYKTAVDENGAGKPLDPRASSTMEDDGIMASPSRCCRFWRGSCWWSGHHRLG